MISTNGAEQLDIGLKISLIYTSLLKQALTPNGLQIYNMKQYYKKSRSKVVEIFYSGLGKDLLNICQKHHLLTYDKLDWTIIKNFCFWATLEQALYKRILQMADKST